MTYHATQIADRMARIHHDRLLSEAADQRLVDRSPQSLEQFADTIARRRRARRTVAVIGVGVTIAAGGMTAYALTTDTTPSSPVVQTEQSTSLVVGRHLRAV
ncbi:hypothetical protein [Ilumatobacter sp.]|uniref:hypothetical protein n=1 Tax=Ilumatobacter sp. TaxID=1967498 RepID=UPI003AF65D83